MAQRHTTSRRTRGPSRRSGAAVLLLLVLLVLASCAQPPSGGSGQGGGDTGSEPDTSSGGGGSGDAVQVFFTTTSLVYPDKPASRPSSPLLEAVLSDIGGARTSIDIATFDFDIPQITDALTKAKKRGVKVRMVVDSENLETPEVAEQTGKLKKAKIPITLDNREPFMHNKFIVVDGAITWMGSWNLTDNDTFRNNNNTIRFVDDQISAAYTQEFEQMFGGKFGVKKKSNAPHPNVTIGKTKVELYFSPKDGVAKYVLKRLEQAKRSIRFMTFSYTSDPIADAMLAKEKAGLKVQGVFEAQNASGTGSEFAKLKRGDIDVLEDGNCYILHHKVIVIDDKTVITGSYNFTSSAERDNDENLVIVDDAAVAKKYVDEFQRLYKQASAPRRCGS